MARPRKPLDETVLFNYARLGASNREIADMMRVAEGTIRAPRFKAILAAARAKARLRLRSYQWKAARSGNVVMQIWLGKQLLAQTDSPQTIVFDRDAFVKPDAAVVAATPPPGAIPALPSPGEIQGGAGGTPVGQDGTGEA